MKVLSNFLLPSSSPAWSSANGQQSILKVLLNSRFLPIPLNKKRRGDGRSFGGNRGTKVVETSSKDNLLRIPLHSLSLRLPRIGICVCREDYIENGGGDNPSPGTGTPDTERGDNEPSTGTDTPKTDNIDGGANDPGTGTPDTDGGANNPGIRIDKPDTDDIDRIANNLGTKTPDIDEGADDLNTGPDLPDTNGKADDRRADDPGTDTQTQTQTQTKERT